VPAGEKRKLSPLLEPEGGSICLQKARAYESDALLSSRSKVADYGYGTDAPPSASAGKRGLPLRAPPAQRRTYREQEEGRSVGALGREGKKDGG